MAEEFHDDERAILKENFPALLIDRPGNSVSAMRVAAIIKGVNPFTAQIIKSAIASKLAGKALDLLPKLLNW